MTEPITGRPLRHGPLLGGLLVALVAACAASPFVGPTALSLDAVLDASIPAAQNADRIILLELRLPRVLMAAVAGAALAIGGAVFQALLRNDLATPYTLGVSGGASFAALLALSLGGELAAGLRFSLLPPAAFLGATASVAVILALAHGARSPDRMATLLLAGVTLNLLFGAGILVVQYLSDPFQAYGMIRWMMGGLDVANVWIPALCAPLVLLAVLLVWRRALALNLMTMGDESAQHLGVDTSRARIELMVVASAATALVVSFVGPIGFVGLIVPHAMRRLAGPDHRGLVITSAVAGALLLVVCDTVGRLVGGEREFPVGVVTACLGGPFFLAILLRARR